MKKRLIIIASIIGIIIISMPFALIFLNYDYKIIYAISVAVIMVYLGLYAFVGVPRFLTYLIYGLITALAIFLLPRYQQAVIAVGTLLFLINPLSNVEQILETKLSNEDTLPLRITIRGRYWPFFTYRKHMEEQYYLPQAKKLFTKKWYLRMRQALMILMMFLAVYLFINELKDIAFSLTQYDPKQIIQFYYVIALFAMTFTLFKKGFTAFFRMAITVMFIPVIYLIVLSQTQDITKWITGTTVLVIAVIYWIHEKNNSLKRVLYHAYEYRDVDTQSDVYANALYEPLVYNEVYALVGIYELPMSGAKFDRAFHDVLYYANRKHFIITAYTVSDHKVMIYTEFYNKHVKRTKLFHKYLEELFDVKVKMDAVYDVPKRIYEKNFFHKQDYIVARTLSLAELLIELEGETEIIISMVFSFKAFEDMQAMAREYSVTRMPELDDETYYAARISTKSSNRKYMIESKVRDMLLTGMIHHGEYVRVLVYY